jgi:glutamyl-tRNA reductase
MKYTPGESYKQWAEKVKQYELGRALMQVAQGQDPVLVLEKMSYSIVEKMMHPLTQAVKSAAKKEEK